MAIRFRKSFTIVPGLRINVSKTGVSTSIGPKGATVNLRKGKRRLTTGIPGSGLSQTHSLTPKSQARGTSPAAWIALVCALGLIVYVAR